MKQETITQDDLQSYSLQETKDIVLGKVGTPARDVYEKKLKSKYVNRQNRKR